MDIHNVEFIISNTELAKCPQDKRPEYAFIGRSNVGKSSLINKLANHKKLAHISSKPGKTQLINHFLVDNTWYLVDLPGYGYAKVSKTSRVMFKGMIEDYILERQNLVNLFVLIDSRIPPQKIDLEFMAWLGENNVPFSMVYTKTDKIKSHQVTKNLETYRQTMLETWTQIPVYFTTSAETGLGKQEILNYIGELNAKVAKT